MESGGDVSEIRNLFQVLLLVLASLSYCYYIAAKIPSGVLRFLSLLPVVYLFILLPLHFSSIHLCGLFAFLIVWLANFKLILFSLDQAPLYPPPPKLFHFICVGCLPIKIKPPVASLEASKHVKTDSKTQVCEFPFPFPHSVLLFVKVVLLGLVFYAHNYKQHFHESLVSILYCCHIYLQLELILALCAAPARILFGFELEPQFNEPYLSTSLQDFWGRRWNLMVTGILRPTVYYPVRCICFHLFGSRFASLMAVIAVFTVSGLMHEVMFYYLTRVPPTWEVFSFFVLQGVCVFIEVQLKTALAGKFRLHPAISAPLVVAFVMVTSVWLFWPQLLRNGVDENVISEFFMALDFLEKKTSIMPFRQ